MRKFFLKSTDESMKRLGGFILIISAAIVICFFKQEYIVDLLYSGVVLIVGGVADSLITKIK